MDKGKVLSLAQLARIKLSDAEAESLSQEFGSILNYVGEVKSVSLEERSLNREGFPNRNVFREDSDGHESGIYTEKLLAEAPSRQGDFIKVKKIL